MTRALPALLVVLALGGCRKDPTCEAIVDHLIDLRLAADQEAKKPSAAERAEMVEGCRREALPAAARRCVMDARDAAGLAACKEKR